MEVLISIGVLSVGLLGLLALVPLVAARFRDSEIDERKSTLGRNWAEEFVSRGYGNPAHWAFTLPANASANVAGVATDRTTGTFQPRQAVLIDPWMGIRNDQATYFPFPDGSATETFNAVSQIRPSNAFAMWRISLRNLRGNASLPLPRATALVDSIFTDSDELSQIFPDKRGDPVQAVFVPEVLDVTAPPADRYRRLSENRFSWSAMLVPMTSYAAGENVNKYRLSVIVYLDRGVDPTGNEFVGTITGTGASGFLSGGLHGGDVEIVGLPAAVREGNWVMLSGQIRHPVASPAPILTTIHRWYQVVKAPIDPDPTQPQRITLLGSDWPVDAILPATTHETHVTFDRDVVGVIERTITLERDSSAWSSLR